MRVTSQPGLSARLGTAFCGSSSTGCMPSSIVLEGLRDGPRNLTAANS